MSPVMLIAGRHHHIQNQPQATHPVRVQRVAGTPGLVRVVADLGAALLAEQRLDGGVDVQYPWGFKSRPHAGQKLRPEPLRAFLGAHPRQRPA